MRLQPTLPDVPQAVRQHAGSLLRRLTLYRHLHRGDRVSTPQGEGTVLQVFFDRITVHLDGAEHTDFFEPEAVLTPQEHRYNGLVRSTEPGGVVH